MVLVPMGIPQLQFADNVIDDQLCWWCEFTGAVVEKTVALPRLHSLRISMRSDL